MTDEVALLAANSAYYEAFLARDNEAMAALWAREGVSCVHPGWPPLIGRRAVLSSYADIFLNPLQQPVTRAQETVLLGENEGRVLCIETVGAAALAATNWFRRVEGRWLLLHHQASPLAVTVREQPSRGAMH
ncbi:MAG: nuclear transport factor 2 family protein [Methylocystis sp.]